MPYRTSSETAERKRAMRSRLLQAARTLFATHGYAATTMQQIVQAAGTSIGNCYFYFPDKSALLLALVEESSADLGRVIDAAIADLPPGSAQLPVAIYSSVLALLQQPDLARLMLVETGQPQVRQVAMAHFTARIERVFRDNPALLSGADPGMAAYAWQGAVFNVLEGVMNERLSGDPATVAHFLARWNVRALGLPAPVTAEALAALDQYIARHSGSDGVEPV